MLSTLLAGPSAQTIVVEHRDMRVRFEWERAEAEQTRLGGGLRELKDELVKLLRFSSARTVET
jgi:hypothetical protein